MKRTNILSKLKSQVKLIESLITEGDHWPEDYRRKAINRIRLATDVSKYSDADIERDVDSMFTKFTPLSHKNSNLGYFLPIVRMFIGYTGNDQAKRKEFLNNKMDMLVKTLGLISHDPSLESKFKDDIKQKWSLEDFEKHAAELQAEIDKVDATHLASVDQTNASDYDVILIESYEELHKKFGGDKTGYKGQSEWCHTNGKSTYDSWTDKGTKQFFVLAKKGWENIEPPDPKTTNAYDEYGTSLIAILVIVDGCVLKNATLRWNHMIEPSLTVPKTSVDKAFLGWGDLSKAVGFNVKTVVEKELQDHVIDKTKKTMTAVNDKLKTVTEITYSTFTDDEKRFITHLDIPNNVTSIGEGAFRSSSLISITIPDSVTSIGIRAFWGCGGLTSVTIPDSVTSIGGSAFSGCSGLTSVAIGNGVKNIGDGVFSECDGLTSVSIPDSVTSIGDWAFSGCSGLTRVTIGNSVTSIGSSAFEYCDGLTSITIPDSVTKIGYYAFCGCSGLTSMTIPDSVTSIGEYAFEGCDGLTSVTIGNSVTSIGWHAFEGCSGLTSVTIPDSVTSIGDNAFYNCSNLTNITIPDSVTSIGDRAFKYCDGLTSITIPDTVTSIGGSAFKSCLGLTNITFEGKTLDEVKAMIDYPWGIDEPEEVIRVADVSK